MVEMITQWPGHAAEEVERLITVPIEVEMNGLPKMTALRSISLYGLSDVRMTFEQGTDNYFARQRVFERLPDLSLPNGVTPSVAPLFSPSGLVYRYVLESPDRTPMELKTIEDWIVERQYRSVPGRGGRLGPRGRDDAVPGAARPGEARRSGPLGARRCGGVRRQQRQRRRRLLLAGRTVLLRARPRPAADSRGHRQRRSRRPQRHPGARQGRGPRRNRPRAAPGPVRLQRARRRRRGRHPDAHGGAGAGRPEKGRGKNARSSTPPSCPRTSRSTLTTTAAS